MVTDQAFILHKTAYKDSSELIKLMTLNHGIIDVIAKGSRKPKSKFNGQLQPFITSQISFTGRSDLKTLVQSEQIGIKLVCDYLNHVSMLYCNELLLLLRFNDSSQQALYDHYSKAIKALQKAKKVSLILRQFEWQLCCALGYELSLPESINSNDYISFHPVNGLEISSQELNTCAAGSFTAFINNQPLNPTQLNEINSLMRSVIKHMTHGKIIQSRALLLNPIQT